MSRSAQKSSQTNRCLSKDLGISSLELIVGTLLLTAIFSIGVITIEWVGSVMSARHQKSQEYFQPGRDPVMKEKELVVERDVNGHYVVTYKTG